MKLEYNSEDIKLLKDIEVQASKFAAQIFDLAIREKIESFRISLSSIHNSLMKSCITAGNVIDRINYLNENSSPNKE